ncbi:MAG: DUF2332 domain-containing protein [Gaiellaceae bacterium]
MAAKPPWRPPETGPEVFEAMAAGVEDVAPDTAALYRRCAVDPCALSLISPKPTWDAPHRLLAAVRWLVLAGEIEDFETAPDPWSSFRAVLGERGGWVARFVRERPVQTNEVQRCWALVPIFLTVARLTGRPLDLVELGASAGLNLLWDRYRYRYEAGTWGDPAAPLELAGSERQAVPSFLLEAEVEVRGRRGIDLDPVDVTTEGGLRLLYTFVRDEGYRTRLRLAADVLRADPPEVMRGDYLDLLPGLLRERSDAALTVVYQTLSTVYLSDEQRAKLRTIVDAAGEAGPLAWISTPTPEEHGQRRGDYPLELAVWPGGARRMVARMNVRGEWLEWMGYDSLSLDLR